MRSLLAGLAGLAVLSLGCGTGRAAPSEPAPQSATQARGETRVQIDNENFNDMNIYLIDAGTRVFLGSVNGLSKGEMSIPRGASSSTFRVRLLADPIGGSSAIATPSLTVGPGEKVYWTIGASPANSFASTG